MSNLDKNYNETNNILSKFLFNLQIQSLQDESLSFFWTLHITITFFNNYQQQIHIFQDNQLK